MIRLLLLTILLTGCASGIYGDPNIYWPQTWQVDNHAEKDRYNNLRGYGIVNFCSAYG